VAGYKDGTSREYVLKIDPNGIGTTIDLEPLIYGYESGSLDDLAVNDRGAVIAVGSGIGGDGASPVYLVQFEANYCLTRDWLFGPEGQTAGGNAIAANSRGQFVYTGYSFINDGDILVSGVSAIGRLEE